MSESGREVIRAVSGERPAQLQQELVVPASDPLASFMDVDDQMAAIKEAVIKREAPLPNGGPIYDIDFSAREELPENITHEMERIVANALKSYCMDHKLDLVHDIEMVRANVPEIALEIGINTALFDRIVNSPTFVRTVEATAVEAELDPAVN